MRITGGQARGIPLTTGQARQVRPATDRMREAVFSSLGGRVVGAVFLDLFAGAGSYGLEALSRGATSGVLVEKDPAAVEAIRQNLAAVLKSLGHPPGRGGRVVRQDVLRFTAAETFSLIFMDPPYDLARSAGTSLLDKAAGLLGEGGLLVYEMPADLEAPRCGWRCLRRIGKSGTNEPSAALLERA